MDRFTAAAVRFDRRKTVCSTPVGVMDRFTERAAADARVEK